MSDQELDCLVHRALLASGRLPPAVPEDVPYAMAGFDESHIDLPPGLLDDAAVAGGRLDPVHPTCPPLNPETVEALAACAARNGNEIPDAVRARMAQDRAAAEREPGNDGK